MNYNGFLFIAVIIFHFRQQQIPFKIKHQHVKSNLSAPGDVFKLKIQDSKMLIFFIPKTLGNICHFSLFTMKYKYNNNDLKSNLKKSTCKCRFYTLRILPLNRHCHALEDTNICLMLILIINLYIWCFISLSFQTY